MAKLNGYRIVNLTYNVKDNSNSSTNKIIDQNFELDGLQSLMLLQNGGGKSVQIQMLIAPFVSPKHRDFGSRPFTDYFNDDKTPTYISTEWLLDNGEKVLIGLMVRKCKPNEVTEYNKGLDIYAYIYEYKDKSDEYSIANMPFARRTDDGYIISSTRETLDLFEEIKKKNKFAMKYYNLSVSGSRAKYYEELKTYDIERSEWESIMKIINLSEGGLTELFKNCSDESKLIEEWFLKLINSKLNKELNSLEEMKTSFKRYFDDKRSKQHAIDVVNGIEEYTQYANNILEVNNQHKEALLEIEKNKSRIEDIYTYNYITSNQLNEQKEKCIESQIEIEKDLAMIKYKEASYKYYMAQEKLNQSEKLLNKERENEKELNSKLTNLEKEDKLQDIIKINDEKRTQEKELEELLAKREKENQSNEQIRVQLENVAYSLRAVLNDELDEKYEILDDLESQKENLNEERSDINIDTGRLEAKNDTLNKDKIKTEKIIKELKPNVDLLCSKYNTPLFIDNVFFERLEENKNTEILDTENKLNNNKEELISLNNDLKTIDKEINNIDKSQVECEYNLKGSIKELDKIQEKCNKMSSVIEYLELNTDDIFNTQIILKEINDKLNTVNKKISADTYDKNKMQLEIEQLEKGVVVEIPQEVKNLLKDLDINYQLGLYYISKLNISLEQKEELINNNPFLPFSIVMDSADIEILKNSEVELSSSYTVYIANKDKISTSVEYSLSNNISEVGDLNILYNFNKALLDENEKSKMIIKIRNEIENISDLIYNNELYRNNLESKKYFVQNFNISKVLLTTAQNKVKELEDERDRLSNLRNDKIQKRTSIITDLIPCKEEDIEKIEKELNLKYNELKEIKQFTTDYFSLEENLNNITIINDKLKENEKTLNNYSKRIDEINQQSKVLDKKISKSKNSIEDTDKILEEISSLKLKFENPVVVKEDKVKLEAQFKVLKEDSTRNIKEIQENISKVNNKIKELDNEITKLAQLYNFEPNDYTDKEYIVDMKILITKSIQQVKAEISSQKDVLEGLISEKSKMETNTENSLKAVLRENNNTKKVFSKYNSSIDIDNGPIDKNLITDTNFKELKNCAENLLKYTENEKEVINKKISLVNVSSQKLGFLSNIREGITDIDSRVIENEIILEDLINITDNEIEEYKKLEKSIYNIKSKLDELFTQLSTDFKYRDIDPYAKNIKSLLEIKHSPVTVEIAINSTLDALEKRRIKYENDLRLIDEEHRSTVNTVLKYVENIHSHMNSIDVNSSININNKRVKMLEIKQPEWDSSVATSKIELFIEKLMDGCNIRHSQGESSTQTPDEFIASQLTTSRLYDVIIGINNVKVTIKKLEFAGEEIDISPISWQKAQKNSGGEGFATYFIILISLLSYMRKESSLIGDRTKESSKVLIMDNPFGKISSEHLLKPVMEIAKKYNTQLVCFTAQKGDNIYNEFENIYHLNLELIRSSKTKILTAERELKVQSDRNAHLQSTQLRLLTID